MIRLEIPGVPVPKGRARLTTINGHARAFTPSKTRQFENLIRLEAGKIMGERPPMEGPLAVTVSAYVPIPKAFSIRKRDQAEAGEIRPVTRPDVDNFIKASLDGLNGVVFRDDAQIVQLIGLKNYSERPRLAVLIERVS